jgi:hypothetical protein
MSLLKKIILNLSILLAGMLTGTLIGVVGGFGLGWVLSLGYERREPGDPGHAPVYVALGLGLYGAGLGAIVGIAGGVGLCILLAVRRATCQVHLPPPPSIHCR